MSDQLSDADREELERQARLHLRVQRRECMAEIMNLLPRMSHLTLEHEALLTLGEKKVIGGAQDIMREIWDRMRRLNDDE